MHYEEAKQHLIYEVVYGSHAYGLNTPESDLDIRGIFIAPIPYKLGLLHVEQVEKKGDNRDIVLFEIAKFFKLAIDNNPSIMEILFVDPLHVKFISEVGSTLRALRHDFLSKKVRFTFGGYAQQQLRRIKTHRKWLIDPPDHQPTRDEFNLPEKPTLPKGQLDAVHAIVQKQMDSWEIDFGPVEASVKINVMAQISKYLEEMSAALGYDEEITERRHMKFMAAASKIGLDTNFLALIEQEKKYRAAMQHWSSYQDWKKNRNPKRAELEAKYGYDTKHAMHLVRLLRMAKEILREGEVRVFRSEDHAELLAIRTYGAWSYDKLVGWAEDANAELDDLVKTSDLPSRPNHNKLNQVLIDMTETALELPK